MVHFFYWSLKKHIESHQPEIFTTKGSSDVLGQEGFLVNGLLSQNGKADWMTGKVYSLWRREENFIHYPWVFKTDGFSGVTPSIQALSL